MEERTENALRLGNDRWRRSTALFPLSGPTRRTLTLSAPFQPTLSLIRPY
jgi:hypothetical protein